MSNEFNLTVKGPLGNLTLGQGNDLTSKGHVVYQSIRSPIAKFQDIHFYILLLMSKVSSRSFSRYNYMTSIQTFSEVRSLDVTW